MEDSILDTTKKLLGIDASYTAFDLDIILHINSVFMYLEQLGVGPAFSISDSNSKWSNYLTSSNLEAVKSFMGLKVRMIFDPPQSSAVAEAINHNLAEMEWRLGIAANPKYESTK